MDEKWKDWAYEMMKEGFESEHLVELAGIVRPYNQFELEELTTRTFQELNLDYSDNEEIIYKYIDYLIEQVLEGKREIVSTLRTLKNFYLEMDNHRDLQDFAMLYWAKEDLGFADVQWYWPEADRSNIDKIILDYFKTWKNKYK